MYMYIMSLSYRVSLIELLVMTSNYRGWKKKKPYYRDEITCMWCEIVRQRRKKSTHGLTYKEIYT